MNHYLLQFITVAGLHLLAVMSPGPDFMLTVRNAVSHSRKSAIFSAAGLGAGILVHVTYSLLGLAYIISKSILLFSIIKFLGGAYLIYLGIQSFRSRSPIQPEVIPEDRYLNWFAAIRSGFLTNALNPKATLFFLSLFTLVIEKNTPLFWKLLYGIEMSVVTFLWFSFVALVFTHPKVRQQISRVQSKIEKVIGVALVALGLKLISTRLK